MGDDPDDPLEWLAAEQDRHAGGSRVEFQEQLRGATAKLVELGTAVSGSILPVTRAFLDADQQAADDYATTERRVRRDCGTLEEACYLLLARQSPVGGDLRTIVATTRCVVNVDRSSSLLRHIARSLSWIHPPAMPDTLRTTVRDLAERAAAVFAGGVQAWRALDGLAAVELERIDDDVDLLQKVLLTELYTGEQSTEEAVSLALIARYFERIGDHGVEMARQVTYAVTGQRVDGSTSTG